MEKKTYRLVYPTAGRTDAAKGEVIRELTDEQADRMRRYTRRPGARLRRVELVQDGDESGAGKRERRDLADKRKRGRAS